MTILSSPTKCPLRHAEEEEEDDDDGEVEDEETEEDDRLNSSRDVPFIERASEEVYSSNNNLAFCKRLGVTVENAETSVMQQKAQKKMIKKAIRFMGIIVNKGSSRFFSRCRFILCVCVSKAALWEAKRNAKLADCLRITYYSVLGFIHASMQ